MNFNRKSLVLVALLAAGCGGGVGNGYSGGSSGSNTPPPAPPPEPTPMAFAPFVKAQFAQTSNTSDPTPVNDQQWEFDENETAFDDVLQ